MASQLRFGSPRIFVGFVGIWIVIGILVELDKGSGFLSHATAWLWVAIALIASVVVLTRVWRKRGSSDGFGKATPGNLLDALPPKWRRSALGEDEPR